MVWIDDYVGEKRNVHNLRTLLRIQAGLDKLMEYDIGGKENSSLAVRYVVGKIQ